MSEMGGLRAAEREPGERRGRLRRRGARLHARRTRRRCAAPPSVGAAPDSSRGLQRENAPGRVQGVAKVAAGRMRWRRRRQGGARRGAEARATRAAGRRRGSAPAASTHSARQLQRLDEEGDHAARGTWREREPMPCSAQSDTVVDASLSQWIGAAGSRCVSGRGLPQANPTDSCRADLRRLACGRVASAV